MEQFHTDGNASGGVPRRTVVKGVAWSIPVIAAATAVPLASASTTGETISGTPPVPSATCAPVGNFTVNVTTDGAPAVGVAVTVTLPTGFTWSDGTSAPRQFTTDSSGNATVTGVVGPARPGTYAVTASVVSGGTTVSTSIPVFVQGTWLTTGPGYSGTAIRNVYENPADVNSLPAAGCVAYCIEHNVTAPNAKVGYVGDASTYLGNNKFATGVTLTNSLLSGTPQATLTADQVQAKVEWIIRNSYPSVSIADLEAATGQTGLTANIVIEAAQYAIWDYTDRGGVDGNWPFVDGTPQNPTPNFQKGLAVYTYLANGAWNDTATAPSSCLQVISSASQECTTPTGSNHIQSVAMVCDC